MDRKYSRLLAALCIATYFVSYLTRINYGAVIAEIVAAEGYTKSAVSMAVTGSFVTYGVGQLLSGYLGDRVKPQLLIFIGLLTTSAMNFLVPLVVEPHYVLILWCINGFAQALMWPPMVKIMSLYMTDDEYKTNCVKVSWGASFAMIVIYLIAPLFIRLTGWKGLFVFCASVALVYAFVWKSGVARVTEKLAGRSDRTEENGIAAESTAVQTAMNRKTVVFMIGCIMLAIAMQGSLRDGVTTWMPTYINETYHLGSAISILTGVAMPCFSIVCLQLSSWSNRKLIRNEMLCSAAWFLPGFLGSLVLSFLPASSAVLSVVLSTVVTGSMHGVNMILTGMIPPYFKKSGNVSFMSGLLNSCTYVGSALSSYGFAVVAERKGWNAVMPVWAAAAFAGVVLCLAVVRPWKRYTHEKG